MKKLLLASAVAATLVAPAFAADLAPRYAKAPMMDPATNWTGFYVGAAGGYSWASADRIDLDYFEGYGDFTHRNDGGIIGGTLGYNVQKGHIVYGVEGDMSYLSNKSSYLTGLGFGSGPETNSSKIDGLATVRGRIGLAIDDALFYTTAGVAIGDVKHSYANASDGYLATSNGWRVGWTAGAGFEQKLSSAWSWKVEGLYYQLADKTVDAADPNNGGEIFRQKFSDSGFIARAGLNYAIFK